MTCTSCQSQTSAPKPKKPKRSRDKYSRVICLGCRERRIRCELPSDVAIPPLGELRTLQTPCYRCKRLGVPCVVRQTVLGRPSHDKSSPSAVDFQRQWTGDVVSRIVIELPSRTVTWTPPAGALDETQLVSSSVVPPAKWHLSKELLPSQEDAARRKRNALMIHTPQCSETVLIINALDTLRSERVEEEWFRHLPAHVGHTQALDLSIKAIVAACAYARGVPKITSGDCYRALALALNAMQADIKQSHGGPNDNILASTALLAPFDGAIKKHGVTTRLHVEGLAAILSSRPATYPATKLAREILEFHICESFIMACVLGMPSPFEGVSREYFANNRIGCIDSDQAQLKALGNELYIGLPRLVRLVRLLRLQPSPQNQVLLDALRLSKYLLSLQDTQAEERLLRNMKVDISCKSGPASLISQSLHFASVRDYEALVSYWQCRLSLLRLERCLLDLSVSSDVQAECMDEPENFFPPTFGPSTNEMFRLVKNILMCADYTETLHLRKHNPLIAHGIVAVWGVKMDMPMALSSEMEGKGKDVLSDMLFRGMNKALKETNPDLTVEDMDTAADIFVGGELTGKFVELYGLYN